MAPLIAGGLLEIGFKLVDKLVTSDAEKARAQLDLLHMQKQGELDEMQQQLSVIISDSQSADPWTSRARPSFLYVVYVLLLWAIPMGVLTIFSPESAKAFTDGFKAWLGAIPDGILQLFGVVMTGYVMGRSWEKVKGAAK